MRSARRGAAWPRASCTRPCRSRGSRGRASGRPARGSAGRLVDGLGQRDHGDRRRPRSRARPRGPGRDAIGSPFVDGQLGDGREASGSFAPRDQAPPGGVLGGDVRRLRAPRSGRRRVAKSAFTFWRLVPLGRDPVDPPGGLVAEGVAADAARRTSRRRRPSRRARRQASTGRNQGSSLARKTLYSVRNAAPLRVIGKKLTCRVPASASRTPPRYSFGQQVALVDHDAARAAVAGADELGDVARARPRPSAGGCPACGSRSGRRPSTQITRQPRLPSSSLSLVKMLPNEFRQVS